MRMCDLTESFKGSCDYYWRIDYRGVKTGSVDVAATKAKDVVAQIRVAVEVANSQILFLK